MDVRVSPAATRFTICWSRSCCSLVLSRGLYSLTRSPACLQIREAYAVVSPKSFATDVRVSPAATRFTICWSRSCRSLAFSFSLRSLRSSPAFLQIREMCSDDNPMSFATDVRVSPAATRFRICRLRSCRSSVLSERCLMFCLRFLMYSPPFLQITDVYWSDSPKSFATDARVSPAATRFTICWSRSCRALVLSCWPSKCSPAFLQIRPMCPGVSLKSFATDVRVSPAATRFTICRSRSCRSLVLSRRSLTRIPALLQITEICSGVNPKSFAMTFRFSPSITRPTIRRLRSLRSCLRLMSKPILWQMVLTYVEDSPMSWATEV